MSPVYSRRQLRQSLGQVYIHDTLIGQTDGSWGTQAGSMNISDAFHFADPTLSGQQFYYRHTLRLLGSAGFIQDVRVGSFNTGSGTFIAAVTLATTVFSGMPFELHGMVTPDDKDRALDEVIRDVRYRQEVPLWSIRQGEIYSIGPEINDVLDVRYLITPTDSLNIQEHQVKWFKVENTGTGNQLRIFPSLDQSMQLIVDALLTVSLGAGDLATVNLPEDDWVLWGAAARCYFMIESKSPGQETSIYRARRQECAREYTRLSARFQPKVTRRIQLDVVY